MDSRADSSRRRLCRMGAWSETVRGGYSMLLHVTLLLSIASLHAQTPNAQTPDLTGVWGQYRGGRGADPKLAPPAAGPLVLKPEYAKPYETRRAAEAEAQKRGEQLANGSVQCVP